MQQIEQIRNGVFFPDEKTSALEKRLFADMESRMVEAGFKYLSVPSLVTRDTYERQGIVPWEKVFKIDHEYALAGSAEQGILEMFKGQEMSQEMFYAKNQCFRAEKDYEGMKRLREFIKLEQFVFCYPAYEEHFFQKILNLSTNFLKDHGITYRVVDVSKRDEGYHQRKYDVEVHTNTYGWMETHSCSSFGYEQTRRFDITGNVVTLSNTGIASPRILVPFLER
jgi:seryl-tRNA synthetase